MNGDYPYGECECRDGHCPCARGRIGPAAFAVTRDGREMRVCTKCDLTSDAPTKRLLVQEEDSLEPFKNWDPLGAFCIIGIALKARGGGQ